MYIESVEGCCTAMNMYGLDDVELCKNNGWSLDLEATKWVFMSDMYENIKPFRRLAILIAFTESNQKWVEECLEELGFDSSGYYEKEQHENTIVKLWWIHIPELIRTLQRWLDSHEPNEVALKYLRGVEDNDE